MRFLCAIRVYMVSLQALWQMRSVIMLPFLKINLHQVQQMGQMVALSSMSQAYIFHVLSVNLMFMSLPYPRCNPVHDFFLGDALLLILS